MSRKRERGDDEEMQEISGENVIEIPITNILLDNLYTIQESLMNNNSGNIDKNFQSVLAFFNRMFKNYKPTRYAKFTENDYREMLAAIRECSSNEKEFYTNFFNILKHKIQWMDLLSDKDGTPHCATQIDFFNENLEILRNFLLSYDEKPGSISFIFLHDTFFHFTTLCEKEFESKIEICARMILRLACGMRKSKRETIYRVIRYFIRANRYRLGIYTNTFATLENFLYETSPNK